MCGIAGVFSPHGGVERVVESMIATMMHRGPNAEGIWSDKAGRCVLGHRRLSIIDTSDAGRQPMVSGNGRWVISFNGEIYNFQELRPLIEAEGLYFQGRTDTEVLLNAIALWGIEALPRLDGMFAFAAFNPESGELILARDPFGEKPLYYMELPGGGLAFASELQALEKVPGFDGDVSLDAMAEVLMFQYIGAPRTIYRKVSKLPPGHWLSCRAGEPIRIGRYFEFTPGIHGFDERPIGELADELEDILVRSIRRRLISDVPLGAFLSGGVDSSTVCALVRCKLGLSLKTFSIGFDRAAESEHEAARAFARYLGTEHHDQILAPDTSEFLLGIGRILDEPNADSSCMPTYLLSGFARQHVTVALSGDGGDEMFTGYGRYFSTLDDDHAHGGGGPGIWQPGQAYYSDRILVSTEKYIEELFGRVPEELALHVDHLRGQINQSVQPLFCRLRKTDVDNYMPGAVLPKVDRMSMQHSLEVRTPFLNMELARFAERLPLSVLYGRGRGKLILREIAYRYLPKQLIDTPKKGFGIPMSRWGKKELVDVASKLLETGDSRLREALGPDAIDRFMKRQRSTSGFSTYQVWALAMLESWARHHPARFPAIGAGKHQSKRPISRPQIQQANALFAWPVGEKLYVVLEDGQLRLDTSRCETEGEHERRRQIAQLMLRMLLSTEIPPVQWHESLTTGLSAACIKLPWWGDRRIDLDSEVLQRLKGSTLLFPESDISQKLDAHELKKLQKLGADKLIFFHPYRYDRSLVQLNLRQQSLRRRLRDIMRLWPHRVATVSFVGRLKSVLRKKLNQSEDNRYISEGLPRLPPINDVELSGRFMLFEGIRQLPPAPVSHEDVSRLGGGRYSVWSQHCVFSPSSTARLLSRPYWLVERTPATEPFLQIVADMPPDELVDWSSFVDRLTDRFANDRGSEPIKLTPGDCVVLITHALPPGGAERQWCYLAQGLKALGYDVVFVVTASLQGPNGHYLSLLRNSGIEPIELGSRPLSEVTAHLLRDEQSRELLSSNANPFGVTLDLLASVLNVFKPKAMLAQLDSVNLLAAVAGYLAGVPRVVLSFRNYNPSNFPYLDNEWYQPCYRAVCQSPRIVLSGNSHAANADYAAWIGIAPERVAWVPNAIDPADLPDPPEGLLKEVRGDLGLHEETPVILGVFRLSEEKQPLAFIDVCTQVEKHIPRVRVLIAGLGPLKKDMENKIKVLGLERKITLLGRREDIPVLLKLASVVLLTSSHEGMPNILMEAQLAGVPVVATRVGGVSDCVKDGETGFLAESGDVQALSEACINLLLNPAMGHRMGQTATVWMGSYFSKERMSERFLRIASGDGNEHLSDSPHGKGNHRSVGGIPTLNVPDGSIENMAFNRHSNS